ncbi:hypothetical protein DFH28DRAFT_938736 [Melampsora americana]|nr:hypothetical protein DFH28DRAFT_938736 [Melampsora americana]
MFGRVPVTYELTQTVKIKMCQTEVIRAWSIGVLEWCKAMVYVNVDHKTRVENFRQAEKAHVRYDNWASLRLLLKPGGKISKLFQDETYKKSTTWIFCTSNLPSQYFNGLGCGPVSDWEGDLGEVDRVGWVKVK